MKLAIAASGSLQNPAFSPDGKQLSFTRFRRRYNSGNSDIGIFDLNTGKTDFIPLTGEANVSQPGSCWTTRGIIFSTDTFGPDRACYWDGHNARVLFKPQGYQTWEPSWGPDFYVAERHASNGNGPGQIVWAALSNLDDIELLTGSKRDCRQPCVSPDGKRVVFQEQTDNDWQLVEMTIARREERRLGAGTDATYSRDGKRLVFSDNDSRLQILDLVTGARKKVQVETPYSGAPSFSPDDKKIAYEGGPSGDDGGPATSIYLTDVS